MKPFPAFATSLDHVLAELERVDLMIRARVAHLRRVQQEDEHFRGLYISEQEVDALLERPRGAPQWLDGNSSDPAADAGRLDAVDDALRGLAETLAARRSASLAAGIELRLHTLARIFELDAFDVDVLLVCLAVETDLRYEKLYAYLQDDVTRKRPSVDLVIHLLGNTGVQPLAARRHFFAASPLLRHRLVRLLDDPSLPHPPLLARFVKPDDRIVRYLLNTEADDHDVADDLRGVAQVLMPTRGLDDLLLEPEVRSAWRVALPADAPVPAPVVLIDGPSGAGKSSLAAALCFERGCPLLVVDAAAAALAAET
ncbi:MAG: ATPase, family [Rhizobacter sp.]|nr:ATPase, family [Rhizobacter sp.]